MKARHASAELSGRMRQAIPARRLYAAAMTACRRRGNIDATEAFSCRAYVLNAACRLPPPRHQSESRILMRSPPRPSLYSEMPIYQLEGATAIAAAVI